MPQDQLYKELLQEFFREFLELFYPAVAARLDFDRVTFLDKELFTDLPEGSRREADLVARVHRRDGGEPEIVLIHVEIQTQRRGAFAQRMFEYYALFRFRHRLRVYPIVLYLSPGAGGIVDEMYTEELFGDELLRFRYKAVGLPDLQASDYLTQPNPLAPALSSGMRTAQTVRLALRKALILSQRAIIDQNEARRSLLLNIVEQNIVLDAVEEADFQRAIGAPEFEEVRRMITPYEQRGIEIGMQQGMLNGMKYTVLKTMRARFGDLPSTVKARVESINEQEELDRLIDRVLQAESVEALGLN